MFGFIPPHGCCEWCGCERAGAVISLSPCVSSFGCTRTQSGIAGSHSTSILTVLRASRSLVAPFPNLTNWPSVGQDCPLNSPVPKWRSGSTEYRAAVRVACAVSGVRRPVDSAASVLVSRPAEGHAAAARRADWLWPVHRALPGVGRLGRRAWEQTEAHPLRVLSPALSPVRRRGWSSLISPVPESCCRFQASRKDTVCSLGPFFDRSGFS